mmetsp:Transcript_49065/g.73200  ORF Transcript_49065/g.73200 Transcript_49065/m.73200 type:complete len:87 (-) Transcript_49065:84-344(-)
MIVREYNLVGTWCLLERATQQFMSQTLVAFPEPTTESTGDKPCDPTECEVNLIVTVVLGPNQPSNTAITRTPTHPKFESQHTHFLV